MRGLAPGRMAVGAETLPSYLGNEVPPISVSDEAIEHGGSVTTGVGGWGVSVSTSPGRYIF